MSKPASQRKIKKQRPLTMKAARPHCTNHATDLEWKPEECLWRCPVAGCTRIAYAKADDLTNTNPSRPRVINEVVELVIVPYDGGTQFKVYLRLPQRGTLIDITDNVANIDTSSVTALTPTGVTATLQFSRTVVMGPENLKAQAKPSSNAKP